MLRWERIEALYSAQRSTTKFLIWPDWPIWPIWPVGRNFNLASLASLAELFFVFASGLAKDDRVGRHFEAGRPFPFDAVVFLPEPIEQIDVR